MGSRKNQVLISILCSVHIFGLYYSIGDFVYFILDGIGLLIIFKNYLEFTYSKNQNDSFKGPIYLLFICLIVNSISCLIYHDQDIVATLVAMRYFLYLGIYFVLSNAKLSKFYLEKIIVYGATIYLIVFLIQVVIFPLKIVPTGRIDGLDRGLLRFRIEGAGFLMLAGFLFLNRFILYKHKLQLIKYFICLAGLFMLGFRTLLIVAILCSVVLIFRTLNKPLKIVPYLIFISVALYFIYNVPFVNDFINNSSEETSNQLEAGNDYIRFQTFDFYFNKVNVDELSLIFGNGFPQEDSGYGKMVTSQGVESNGYIFADIGLIGFAIIYGILSLVALLWISFKAIFYKLPKDSIYLSIYFLYLLLSSITTVEIYRIGIFGIEALALYLINVSKYSNLFIHESKYFNVPLRQ